MTQEARPAPRQDDSLSDPRRAETPLLYRPSPSEQRTARIMGAWFLGTFLFSIPAYFFFEPLLTDPDYTVDGGSAIRIGIGSLLEILLAVCGIATAVVIYPVVQRVNRSMALGYIAARIVESILILIGVISLLTVVALPQDLAVTAHGNDPYTEVPNALVVLHEQTRLLGPQFCAGLGNGILLGYLMWRCRLLPRPMVIFGLIGGPLAVAAGIGVLLGAWDKDAGLPVALTAPEAFWEFSLSVYLLVKGFRSSPILTGAPGMPAEERRAHQT